MGATMLKLDDNHYFTLTHRRRLAPGALTYGYQSTPDFVTWTDVPGVQLEESSAVPVGDGVTEVVTMGLLPAIGDGGDARFFRLKVSE